LLFFSFNLLTYLQSNSNDWIRGSFPSRDSE